MRQRFLMDFERQRWRVLYFLLFLNLFSGVQTRCVLPVSIRDKVYFHNYDSDDVAFLYTYKSTGGYIQITTDPPTTGLRTKYLCLKKANKGDDFYMVGQLEAQGFVTNQIQCMRIIIGDGFLLERPYKIDKLNQCPGRKEDEDETFNVMLQYPFSSTGITCPLTSGKYQLTIDIDDATVDVCAGDESSIASVTSNTIQLNSCQASAKFKTPFQATMTCMGQLPGNRIDKDDNGGILILSAVIENATYTYCTRYKEDGESISLSLDVTSNKAFQCQPGKDASSYGGKKDGGIYRALKLTRMPNDVTTEQPGSETTAADGIVTGDGENVDTTGDPEGQDGPLPDKTVILIGSLVSVGVCIVVVLVGALVYCYTVRPKMRQGGQQKKSVHDDASITGPAMSGVRSWHASYDNGYND